MLSIISLAVILISFGPMQNKFEITIGSTSFEVLTMNVQRVQLFQVYTEINGVKKRFHIQLTAPGQLKFVMPDDCPPSLLALEDELSREVFRLCAENDR